MSAHKFKAAARVIDIARIPKDHDEGVIDVMLVGNERFDSEEIHRLYDSDDYPLRRR